MKRAFRFLTCRRFNWFDAAFIIFVASSPDLLPWWGWILTIIGFTFLSASLEYWAGWRYKKVPK